MIPAVLRSLARLGFRRALSGPGGRGWLILGLAAATLRVLHKRADEPKAHLVEKIEPGHSLVITHFPRPAKKK
ncbi:MAG: hypothetical protein ACRD12_23415 [Acidimicrobiales bacterium]